MELVSVVVPIYNGVPYIRDAVRMIKAQTYSNLEVIFVNDGSQDDSATICEAAIAGDDRFRLINKENGGTARARNAGLDAAHGAYIIFLDVDDEYHPELINRLVETIEEYETDMPASTTALIVRVCAGTIGNRFSWSSRLSVKRWIL